MSANFDTKFQDAALGQASPFSFTSNAPASGVAGTIGSNSNRILVGAFRFHANVAGAGTVSMTWNSVAMTSLGSGVEDPAGQNALFLFGLKAPDTGAQVLSVSWTGGGTRDVSLAGFSLYNADQTTGWQNYTTNTGTSTDSSVTVTSANGNMVVAAQTDDDASSIAIDNSGGAGSSNPTTAVSDWTERDLNGNDSGAHNASTGASTTIGWNLGSSVGWAMAGIDIIAAGVTNTNVTPAAASGTLTGIAPSRVVGTVLTPVTP